MDSAYRITNYQTSFVIDNRPALEVFNSIVAQIWGWIAEKERKYRTTEEKTKRFSNSDPRLKIFDSGHVVVHGESGFALFKGGKFNARIGKKDSRLRSLKCRLSDRVLWGMEYTERQPDKEWVTEVGITSFIENKSDVHEKADFGSEMGKQNKGVVFYIRVSYTPKRAFYEVPNPSVPRLIYTLLKPSEGNAFNAHGSGVSFNFNGKLLKVASERSGGEKFADFLFSPVRRFPVLVIAADKQCLTGEVLKVLTKMNDRLLGKTLIFVLDPTSPAYRATRSRLRLDVNTLYLIRPREGQYSEPTLEDYGIRQDKLGTLRLALEAHIYRQRPVLEPDAVTPQTIAVRRQQEFDRRLNEAKEQGRLDEIERLRKEKQDEADSYMDLISDEESKRLAAERRVQELEEEKNSLRQRLAGLEQRERGNERREREERLVELTDAMAIMIGKRSLREQVEACRPLFEDRIVLTDKARKSLDTVPREIDFKDMMVFFIALYTRLYPSYVNPSIGNRRENLLAGLSIKYTPNEASLTMDTEKYRKERTIIYNGAKYVCEEHLKKTKGDTRLYFAYSEKERKIIICHIGDHLDTAGTNRRGH